MKKTFFMTLCAAMLVVSNMSAGTIYASTGQTSDGADPVLFLGPLYNSFSTSATAGILSRVSFLLEGNNSSTGYVSVDLFADSGNATVGALISTLGTIGDSSLSGTLSLVTLTQSDNSDLAPNTRYWIGLIGNNTSALWSYTLDYSGTGVNGEYFQNLSGTNPNNPYGSYQMELQETLADATPEPATLLLAASALSALLLVGRRARK